MCFDPTPTTPITHENMTLNQGDILYFQIAYVMSWMIHPKFSIPYVYI